MRVPARAWGGGLAALCLIALLWMLLDESLYVRSLRVGGLRTMRPDEIYQLTDVIGVHAFWLDPAAIRADILTSPTIADVQVIVGWQPDLLTLIISEREPALLWEQGGQAVWIDVNGRVMRQREDRAGLLRVQTEPLMNTPAGAQIEVAVVAGALQLQSLLPAQSVLRFHPDNGLGYDDARGWTVWLGTGTGMPEKLRILEAIAADLERRAVRAAEISLVNPDAPHVITLRRGT
jgi:cell division septal protein FtsQ